MHDYAIEEKLREKVVVAVVIIYIVLAIIFTPVIDNIINRLCIYFGYTEIRYLKIILSVIMPGIEYGILYSFYDKIAWKWFYKWHHIPNLNGKWKADIISELKTHKPIIEMEIKQTWTKIKITGTSLYTNTETSSQTAAFINEEGNWYFIYSYAIKRHNNEAMNDVIYTGYNKLGYTPSKNLINQLTGLYCSQKDITEELVKEINISLDDTIKNKLNGCGSKGKIIIDRVNEN